jgi:hypothetical protein
VGFIHALVLASVSVGVISVSVHLKRAMADKACAQTATIAAIEGGGGGGEGDAAGGCGEASSTATFTAFDAKEAPAVATPTDKASLLASLGKASGSLSRSIAPATADQRRLQELLGQTPSAHDAAAEYVARVGGADPSRLTDAARADFWSLPPVDRDRVAGAVSPAVRDALLVGRDGVPLGEGIIAITRRPIEGMPLVPHAAVVVAGCGETSSTAFGPAGDAAVAIEGVDGSIYDDRVGDTLTAKEVVSCAVVEGTRAKLDAQRGKTLPYNFYANLPFVRLFGNNCWTFASDALFDAKAREKERVVKHLTFRQWLGGG